MTVRTDFPWRGIGKFTIFAESAATPPIPDLGLRIDDLLAARGNASIPPDIRAFYDHMTRDTQGRITFQLYRVGAVFCLLLGALDYSVLPFALFLWMLLFRAIVSLSLIVCGYLFARNTLGRFAPALLVAPHVLAIGLTGIFGFMSGSDILFERYMIIAFFAVLVAVGFVRTNISTSLWMAGLPLLVFTGCMLYSPIDPFAGRLQIILFMGCAAGGVLYGRHVQNQQLARLFLLNTREELRNADAIRLNAQLSSFAYTDQLTNIPNRRYFDEICATMGNGANALLPLAVCFIDIDHFKNLNDALGHLRGDRCLRVVASAISSNLRGRSDILARYGGEEFVLLLPATEIAAALEVAERMRKAVLELNHDNPGSTLGVVSVSIGVAAIAEPPMLIDALIAAADRALYRAKNNGRNLVSL